MSGWLLLHVYVFVDFLEFVDVLFQSVVFRTRNVLWWLGSLLRISAKRICVRRENCAGGLRTKVRGTFGNFDVPPRGFCQVWLAAYVSLRIKHAITILDNCGL